MSNTSAFQYWKLIPKIIWVRQAYLDGTDIILLVNQDNSHMKQSRPAEGTTYDYSCGQGAHLQPVW